MNNKYEFDWVKEPDYEDVLEILDTAQPVYFQYASHDYLIIGYVEGFLIVEPFKYYEEGGFPNDTKASYPGNFEAKSLEEFINLPFLDGNTFKNIFNEIKFFNY